MWKTIEVEERFCNLCKEDLQTRHGHGWKEIDDNTHYCDRCALLLGIVTGEQLAKAWMCIKNPGTAYVGENGSLVFCSHSYLAKLKKKQKTKV